MRDIICEWSLSIDVTERNEQDLGYLISALRFVGLGSDLDLLFYFRVPVIVLSKLYCTNVYRPERGSLIYSEICSESSKIMQILDFGG